MKKKYETKVIKKVYVFRLEIYQMKSFRYELMYEKRIYLYELLFMNWGKIRVLEATDLYGKLQKLIMFKGSTLLT